MKKAFVFSMVLTCLVLFSGCIPELTGLKPVKVTPSEPAEEPQGPIVGGDKDEHGCIGSAGYSWCENKNKCLRTWEEECVPGDTATPILLSEEEAQKIAEESVCMEQGTLNGNSMQNEGTATWWFDMTMKPEFAKEGCNPACVVDEKAKTAEINWRCTGLIPPPVEEPVGFCGKSTYGSCQSDSDCTPGGCSSQVCQSVNEEPVITTCEYTECYDASKYNLSCGCVSKKCQWK